MIYKNNLIKNYNKKGYVIEKCYSKKEYLIIKNFVCNKIFKILKTRKNLKKYHLWEEKFQKNHSYNFRAKNRFFDVSKSIRKIILNKKTNLLIQLLIGKNTLWKDKNGVFSFRIIRPGFNDGYPYSRKEWGPAKKVLSMWVPIIGNTTNETLEVLPKSHKMNFKKYLPKKSKFEKEEYRLAEKIDKKKFKRFHINYGSILFFHPKLIHSEDVKKSNITRINLEFRSQPITK